MKTKRMMRWTLALVLTGVGAALAVVTLDAWTGPGRLAGAAPTKTIVTEMPWARTPETPASPNGSPAAGVLTGTELSGGGSADAASRAIPGASPAAPSPSADESVMLPFASPLPGEEGRLLEQIETARAGLIAAQSTVPVRPPSRAAWLPVLFLAGGGGLIGCALGIGLGRLALRRRSSRRAASQAASAAAPSGQQPKDSFAPDDSAASVLQAARAELDHRATRERYGSPSPAVDPGAAAGALSPARPAAREVRVTATTGPDPVDRRLAALERSLLQVVRAMEEVTDRVVARDASTAPASAGGVRPEPVPLGDDLQAERANAGASGPFSASDGDREEDLLAPPMRAPRRRVREDGGKKVPSPVSRPTVPVWPVARAAVPVSPGSRAAVPASPVARAAVPTPPVPRPAPASGRVAPSVGRAVRALRAARDHTSAAPEPWDLAPVAASRPDPEDADRLAPNPFTPSASTVDGRDLVRVRRAVLRLAAEGWDGGRIASRLRLGEGDVALILKTAGGESSLLPAGPGR